MNIQIDNPRRAEITVLLQQHMQAMEGLSPPESRHVLDIEGLCKPEITFWSCTINGQLAGVGALKQLNTEHGEIKSMKTALAFLKHGVASALLQHIIHEAAQRNYKRLSLETGSMDYFVPAYQLYLKFGFVSCGPFANYVEDPNSLFLTREL
ncbi:GNAT family N-acetyltransferase [Gynuella sunshinyii]|uniref:N-acetylglutamate synthase and related acetyltransferase n=1 Tax=Gynuella sunshinyii YC6258 TaxID=1445510 RepID=A0A0C5VYI9_9GAMM|nr:GNAT family N-acetyltransferase [Gynuella sunshinyii]AJQ95464.1 N-acetylglutamate synthase and related acetyltransferase [Gynuella sunshinyii YC6258]